MTQIDASFEELGCSIANPKQKQNGTYEGKGYRFYHQSAMKMYQCTDESIALTVTSPPYWNAIDYDIHSQNGNEEWHRTREYTAFGKTLDDYLKNIENVFSEVLRVTINGGFCAIVVATILQKGKHYPIPMLITERMLAIGWEFHQDIVWNKVTGGVRRAGCFIQKPNPGYFYPNIMTEYILVFRKAGAPRRGIKQALPIDELFTRDIANNIWHIAPVPPKSIDHPCPYPAELVRRLTLLYSQEEDEVLDPFLGSGQTALVVLKHGRKCVGYDIEKKYLELAQHRISNPPLDRKHNLIAEFKKIVAS
ncbi:MAG: site-specific DNA-methyltransferase [Gammaproteobacteria bacterium]|nr:site-specific DNA-methyltransferase [Gammaproteobacteria bacterium]MXX95893.1 site-specific DNA-methyltransferase [Gammaproteobacteria bacterium]MYF53239.1 site-specific DNA-methyltransferase [Gammaproteobacteria bacterium]MYK44539.1 site-specific DNA-methyltransferase [Gammaproteobacteria bacterium]